MKLLGSIVLIIGICYGALSQNNILTSDWDQSKNRIEQEFRLQHYRRAIDFLDSALSKTLSNRQQAEAFILYSKVAIKTGKYEVANFYIQKLESLLKDNALKDLQNQASINRLQLDFRITDTKEFIKTVRQLKRENELNEDQNFYSEIRSILALCHLQTAMYDSALMETNQILEYYKNNNDWESYSNALQNKAFCLIELKRPDSILNILNKSIQLARTEGNLELQIEGMFLMGKYYLVFGPQEVALMHLDAARLLTLEQGENNLESRFFLTQYYYEFYLEQDQYKEALDWFLKNTSIKDSLYREDVALKSAFTESIQTIANQQSIISRNQLILGLLLICIVVFGIFFVMQRRLLKLRAKTTNKLKIQYESLVSQRQLLVSQKEAIETKNKKLESYFEMLETLANSSQVNQGDTQKALEEICDTIQKSLGVSRVSIWNYNHNVSSINCRLLLENGRISSEEVILSESDFPNYFKALKEKKVIIADDAVTNPATIEFESEYLGIHNIRSMLDAPILVNGQLEGIICCEHIETMRKWETEDTIFLLAVSDFISITLLSEKIKIQNQTLYESNLTLEDSVRMRTMELELQNKQLAEYAFVNSHLLRSPLAKILGIAEIMKYELKDDNNQLINSMMESAEELDVIVKQIGNALYNGKHFTRSEINAIKKSMLNSDQQKS